jgi:hypothetical protein
VDLEMRRAVSARSVGRLAAPAALLLVALIVSIVLCEATARLLAGYPILQIRLPLTVFTPRQTRATDLASLVPTTAPDVDPHWLDESLPPLPRAPVERDLLERVQATVRAGLPPFQACYIWNRRLVLEHGCDPGGVLSRLPQPLLVFDPPEPIVHPPFRYLPARTLPGGLVTNRFGWRGPDIPLAKPAGTVRLAFVGASTTVGLWTLPFSYPEYVIFWLNEWAERERLPVRFDGINAGREGIGSSDIAAIVRQEVLPADPDMVIFYEGANSSLCGLGRPTPAPPLQGPGRVMGAVQRLVSATHDYSALARRLEEVVRVAALNGGREPVKPAAALGWPPGLNELEPDIARRDLPLLLTNILQDLESMRTTLEASGSELAVSSFVWLVSDGLRLDTHRDVVIFRHLNEGCWPYRYADLRRAIDLHNRVLARYAASRTLPFLDVARTFPMDPSLFFDAIHLNEEGTRAHAWLTMQALLPLVRARLEAHRWPRGAAVAGTGQSPTQAGEPLTLSCPSPEAPRVP